MFVSGKILDLDFESDIKYDAEMSTFFTTFYSEMSDSDETVTKDEEPRSVDVDLPCDIELENNSRFWKVSPRA